MKNIILVISLLGISITSVQAFESGIYKCKGPFDYVTFTLKDNGRAKSKYSAFSDRQGRRGSWINDDEAAVIILESNIIEKTSSGYILSMPSYAPLDGARCSKQ